MNCVTTVMQCTIHIGKVWHCESHTTAIIPVVQYQQFLDKNFKEFLIICSPPAKHIRELKEVIFKTYVTCIKFYLISGNVHYA